MSPVFILPTFLHQKSHSASSGSEEGWEGPSWELYSLSLHHVEGSIRHDAKTPYMKWGGQEDSRLGGGGWTQRWLRETQVLCDPGREVHFATRYICREPARDSDIRAQDCHRPSHLLSHVIPERKRKKL